MTPASIDPTSEDSASTLVLSGPEALVAGIPFLLGFAPEESLVMVWLRERRLVLTQRIDLPDAPTPAWALALWGHLPATRPDECIAILVSERGELEPFVGALTQEAVARDVGLRDLLVVADGRWRSQLCHGAECCPPEGRAIDQAIRDRVAAEFTGAGCAPVADRADLVIEFASHPPVGHEPGGVELDDLITRLEPRGRAREARREVSIGVILAHLLAPAARPGEKREPLTTLAALLAGLGDIRVRDTVLWELVHIEAALLHDVLARLAAGVRVAPPGRVAAVATCAAIVAWLLGDGARAQVALERALADQPEYTLALLVQSAVAAGLPPATWRQMLGDLPREACRHGAADLRAG